MGKRTLVLLVLLAGATACGKGEPRPAITSLIAFVTDRDGNDEVYVMRPDGSEPRNVTRNEAQDTDPTWSPDGSRILFVSDRDGNAELYLVDPDGTGLVRLTETPEDESMPAVSPDGTRIAYVAAQGRDDFVCVMAADGSGSRRLCEGFAPSWSPDGKTIVLNQGQLPTICQVPLEGGEAHLVGSEGEVPPEKMMDHLFNVGPRVSPDGGRILFSKVLLDGSGDDAEMNYEVYVLTPATSGFVRLTNQAGLDQACGWSPDGRRVLFVSDRDGNAEVYVMNASGSGATNLTNHPAQDHSAAWSP